MGEEMMDRLGWRLEGEEVGMLLWGGIGEEYGEVEEVREKVLEEGGVLMSGGLILGRKGKGYMGI